MTLLTWSAAVIATLLLVYLGVALLFPERLQ
jgi:K+-transporting ATPase KdpF subunit